MTDTHTHLYSGDFEDGGAGAVRRAVDAGVEMMILPGIDATSLERMRTLHSRFPDNTRIAIGLHPTELGDDWRETLDDMERQLRRNPSEFCAIGETGIDLYWDTTTLDAQKEAFATQYQWALEYDLPLIIHCRDAIDETLEVISSFGPGKRPQMIFHSFTYGPEEVRKIRQVCDPWFGINGVATFKNAAAVRNAVAEIGLDRLVLETDSPYLAPVPNRGKRNESAFLGAICRQVAEIAGVTPEEAEQATDRNAKEIFKL